MKPCGSLQLMRSSCGVPGIPCTTALKQDMARMLILPLLLQQDACWPQHADHLLEPLGSCFPILFAGSSLVFAAEAGEVKHCSVANKQHTDNDGDVGCHDQQRKHHYQCIVSAYAAITHTQQTGGAVLHGRTKKHHHWMCLGQDPVIPQP